MDIHETVLFREIEAAAREVWYVNTGTICDAADLAVSADGRRALFTATTVRELEGVPETRIVEIELTSGALREVVGPDARPRMPSYSVSGECIAYVADRRGDNTYQLEVLATDGSSLTPHIDGWVDQFDWSADGHFILAVVAEHGADRAGIEGAVRSAAPRTHQPAWMPMVHTQRSSSGERRLWVVDIEKGDARPVTSEGINVWEAAWRTAETAVAIVSEGASEGDWYSARLALIRLHDGAVTTLFEPTNQLGSPASSLSGRVAVIEAVCSDRLLVAGKIVLIDPASGRASVAESCGVDVTSMTWLDDDRLLFAGHRGFETAVGLLDTRSLDAMLIWASSEVGIGGPFAKVAPVGPNGDFALVGEAFQRPPEIAVVEAGAYRVVRSLAPESAFCQLIAETVEWRAPDGLQLQGWLLRPRHGGPYPTVLNVHGGPVWHWRQRWLGRFVGFQDLVMVSRGYAIFLPNPRGSTGRGDAFAAMVRGDVGGADTWDYLSGLDHLVARGIADSNRLGVCGGSYGGYMAAWLVTQDSRFAAAVSVAPIINPVTEGLLSSVPHFTRLFFGGGYEELGSHYYARSPLAHVRNAKTPTLILCGARDRVTPAHEAAQFHAALLEHGAESVLVTYPQEGHGVRSWPAFSDFVARVVDWFDRHMPARPHDAIP